MYLTKEQRTAGYTPEQIKEMEETWARRDAAVAAQGPAPWHGKNEVIRDHSRQYIPNMVVGEGYRTDPGQTDDHLFYTYQPDIVRDTTTEANKATLGARLSGLDARQNQTMQAARLGPAAQMGAAQIGTDQQALWRQRQLGLAMQLGAAAEGRGPSVAQDQLKMATDRSMRQQLGLALGARGGNQAAAMKQAQMQQAMIGQEAAAQSAVLRAQEQQAAQASLGQLLAGARGADIGLATTQAGLQQQAAMQNQDALNQFGLQQGQFGQQANAMNLQVGVDQQRQKDAMIATYMQMGMTLDEAQRNADIQQNQFRASLLAQQEAARHGVGLQSAAQGMQLAGGLASAGGAVLGQMLGAS
jgi:hypothetical protein